MKPQKLAGAGIMAVLALFWGLSCRLEPQKTLVNMEASLCVQEDGEGQAVLWPGEPAAGGIRFCNRGRAGCRLRARVWIPEAGGHPAAELVQNLGQKPGWKAEGEYFVYQNDATGDILLPGKWTPELFSEILASEELEAMAGKELAVYITLEGKGPEEEAWTMVPAQGLEPDLE